MSRHRSTPLAAACVLVLAACGEQPMAPLSAPKLAVTEPTAGPTGTVTSTATIAVVEPAPAAELPVSSDLTVTGKVFRVATPAELKSALTAAVPGDHILLKPETDFVGYFRLPAKAGQTGGFVTIRTDLPAGETPPAGVRVTPAAAARFARIVAQGRNDPAVHADPGARGFRFVAVEIAAHDSIKSLGTLVRLGDGSATMTSQIPSDIVLDRVYVHGNPTLNLIRCIFLNSARSAVINSSVHECHAKGSDSNAIGVIASPGPLRIENNSLAGAGMGFFSGGADPRIVNLSPSDIVFRRNHVWRPTTWKGVWTVKNLLELKHAKRVLIEDNLFENNWVDGQSGTAIVLKSVSQNGKAPWSQTADVTFRRNVIRNSPNGLALAAKPEKYPAVFAARIKIEENLFYEIGAYNGTTGGRMLVMSGPLSDVQLLSNTLVHGIKATHAGIIDPSPTLGTAKNFVGRNNITTLGTYGWTSSGAGSGETAFRTMWGTAWEFTGNIVVGTPSSRFPYPVGTTVLASLDVATLTAPVTTAVATGIAPSEPVVSTTTSTTTTALPTVGADINQLAAMAVHAVAGY